MSDRRDEGRHDVGAPENDPSGDGSSPGRADGDGTGPEKTVMAQELGRVEGPPDDPSLLDRFKEFWMTSFAVDHRTSVVVLFLIITVGGILAYSSVPKESFPEVEIPMIAVSTVYPGVSPADVETLITRPLEEELNTISDLEELTSTSVEGYSNIVAEFETSVELDNALEKVREKVDLAKPDLPEDAEDPTIIEFNTEEVPIMQVNLAGEYGLVRLKEIGEELQDRLEQIPTVLRADLRGGLEREVQVDVDLTRLQFYGLAFDDVIEAIQTENVNIPGGSIDVGDLKYLVRVDGEFADPSVIEELVVATVDGRPVYVRDIASVDFGFAERESFARLNGNPVVSLAVVKRSGENIIETAEAVRATVDGMESLFPPTTEVTITSDQSEEIFDMVNSLENNIVSGLILIIAVLLFFLGLRTSVFVALSIPTSMLLSFIVLGMMGISMNMVVLFSLILALGMLVDNAIVIVENIYRYMEEGWERTLAAKKATGEVALPVIAATLTTLAAFAPLIFWPGMIGEFMGYLPRTLIITLSSSLFVAIVIIPTLCAMFMRVESEPREPLTPQARWTLIGGAVLGVLLVAAVNWLTAVLFVATAVVLWALHTYVVDRVGRWFMRSGLPRMLRRYERALRWSLEHRGAVLGIAVVVLVGTFMLFGRFNHGVVFFPEDFPPRQVWVDAEAPVGTRVEFSDAVARRLEEEVRAFPGVERDAESIVTVVGGSGGGGGQFQDGGPSGPNEARVTVAFVDFQDRWRPSSETLSNMQESVGRNVAGAEISVEEQQEGPPTGPPVNIELVGEEPERLKALSDSVIRILEQAPVYRKLVGLESDLDQARPELSVRVDREKAAMYDLSTFKVGNLIRTAIQGTEAAKFRTGNDEYDIVVQLAKPFRSQLGSLQDLTVMAEGGVQVPLSSVADWDVDEGFGTIRRKDMDRMATIRADVRTGYNSNAVLAEAQETLRPFQEGLAPGYTLRYTGQQQEQTDAQEFLSMAFLVALMLIAFILISQFNSVIKPVIILTSVIMSTVGALVALLLFQMPFGIIMSGVGVISLAGIVVNNAIVMIDYIDILRERDGMDRKEALVQGGKTRFRPVVLTAITTALGLVPLAIGLNFDFFGLFGSLSPELFWGGEQAAWWGPMAIVVIVGIIFATVLTLILVPVMYSVTDAMGDLFRRYFVAGSGDEASEETDASASGAEALDAAPGGEERPERTSPEPEPEPVFRFGEPRPGEAG